MAKKKTIPIMLVVFVLILIAAVIFICRCISLAFTDNIRDKYITDESHDNTFLKTLLVSASFGKEFEISETQINTYVNKKYCSTPEKSNSGADHIGIYFRKNAPTEIYAHIFIGQLQFAVRSKLKFSFNSETNTLSARLFDAYVGELGIPDNILSFLLPKIFKNKDNLVVNGTTFIISAKYTYKIKDYDIDLYIREFIPDDGKVQCKTNSLTGQALKVAVEYIKSDEGKKALSGIYNGIKDKVVSWFQ